MNLQQFRYLREVVRCQFNISKAAESLSTSQPGVSKQLHMLEAELGIEIFARKPGRLIDLTASGQLVLNITERVLKDIEGLKQIGREFSNECMGNLMIATNNTHARYTLPAVLKNFAIRHPNVCVQLHQGNTSQVARLLIDGDADIAIGSSALKLFDEIIAIPCQSWERIVIVPKGHELLDESMLTLESISKYPHISYGDSVSSRHRTNEVFEKQGLKLNIVLNARDPDVVKRTVSLGLGIAIITEISFNAESDILLQAINANHLFNPSQTFVGIRRNAFLRRHTYDFLEIFYPCLTKHVIEMAIMH